MLTIASIGMVNGQIGLIDENGKSEYDRQCGTDIANYREAEQFLAINELAFGKDIDDYPEPNKEIHNCVKNVFDQETELILNTSEEIANNNN